MKTCARDYDTPPEDVSWLGSLFEGSDVVQSLCRMVDLLPTYLQEHGELCGDDDPSADLDALHPRHLRNRTPSSVRKRKRPAVVTDGSPIPRKRFQWLDDTNHLVRPAVSWAHQPLVRPEESPTSAAGSTSQLCTVSAPLDVAPTPDSAASPSATLTLLPSAVPTPPPPRVPSKQRRGKAPNRERRGGVGIKKAEGGRVAEDRVKKMRDRVVARGDICQPDGAGYSLLVDGSRTSTGWNGSLPPKIARAEIRRLWSTGEIKEIVKTFYPIPYKVSPEVPHERATFIADADGQIFAYRAFRAQWLADLADDLAAAQHILLGKDLANPKLQAKCRNGARGDHLPCIIGHYRQSMQQPQLTQWHRLNLEAVDKFLALPAVVRMTAWVCSVIEAIFPGVAARFRCSAKWHEERYGIKPLFGLFWNFCWNGAFPGQRRVHCTPHADSKNIVSVCVLLIYILKNCKFNHTMRTWLVLWEAGIVIELPPWVMAAYPSSLFYHFNIDINDFQFVLTNGDERPTPQNSIPISDGDDFGRGSIVYFNQATMFQASETDSDTLAGAKARGHSGKTDYPTDVREAFTASSYFQPVPDSLRVEIMASMEAHTTT